MKYLLLIILTLSSCNNSNKVKIIVPDNFNGVFRISEDSDGKEVPIKDGFHMYKISENKNATFKQIKALENVSLLEVETSSGKKLKAWPPNNKSLEFHNLGISSDGNLHYGVFDYSKLDAVRKDGQFVFDIELFNQRFFKND